MTFPAFAGTVATAQKETDAMKRFLSLLLAALMLVTCASALAEATRYQELGLAFDFSVVQDRSANCPSLNNYGIVSTDPFIASMGLSSMSGTCL